MRLLPTCWDRHSSEWLPRASKGAKSKGHCSPQSTVGPVAEGLPTRRPPATVPFPISNFESVFLLAGGRALIPKNAFGCRTRAGFRVRSLTPKRRRGGRTVQYCFAARSGIRYSAKSFPEGGTMHSRKLGGLILSVFALIVFVGALLPSTNQLRQRGWLVIGSSLVADGIPVPPLPPPKPNPPTVVADTSPLPPPIPPKPSARPTVVADTSPLPPPIPPKPPARPTVVADGMPLPPPPRPSAQPTVVADTSPLPPPIPPKPPARPTVVADGMPLPPLPPPKPSAIYFRV
jgi:hypothetical protein